MTALGITVVTLAFPNTDVESSVVTNDVDQVNTTLSFSFSENNKIRTLSTTDASPGGDISGLLYSPVPDGSFGCTDYARYLPSNATKVILPQHSFAYVALAPWISPACTLGYLKAVQKDPIHAFIFYRLDNSTSIPPLADDPGWALGDGGNWKLSNKFPVYAISSASGAKLISQLALYTGNLTSVPNGHQLASMYLPSDYVRLAVDIALSGNTNLPSLWVFLLIVLAILILIIGSSSFIMHWIQRKRRDWLRRRVANGEVDLEALGIKRLTVPQDVLNKMPIYTYTTETAPPGASAIATSTGPPSPRSLQQPKDTAATSPQSRSFLQPTCAICLDDFVDHESTIRELPCRHIFHPTCVDSFLRENSSLCPMCKQTVLPRGYCPAVITNAMVRRERTLRRIRGRVPRDQDVPSSSTALRSRLSRLIPRGGTASRSLLPSSHARTPAGVEMTETDSRPVAETSQNGPTAQSTANSTDAAADAVVPAVAPASSAAGPPPSPSQPRSEWARQRALAMLGPDRPDGEAEAEEQHPSRWRKVVGKVWPGIV